MGSFVRRLMDTERIEILLSGSSAKLLSREVATSLRGRALEVLIHPFGFREALRHAGAEPNASWDSFDAAELSALDAALRTYLATGGFPEAQGIPVRDRASLLRSYVDVVVLRDVIERHGVSNPVALRWLQRQLLGTPAGAFSVQKLYNTMRSQGIAVGKDTLHEYLGYLEDPFQIASVDTSNPAIDRHRNTGHHALASGDWLTGGGDPPRIEAQSGPESTAWRYTRASRRKLHG